MKILGGILIFREGVFVEKWKMEGMFLGCSVCGKFWGGFFIFREGVWKILKGF